MNLLRKEWLDGADPKDLAHMERCLERLTVDLCGLADGLSAEGWRVIEEFKRTVVETKVQVVRESIRKAEPIRLPVWTKPDGSIGGVLES